MCCNTRFRLYITIVILEHTVDSMRTCRQDVDVGVSSKWGIVTHTGALRTSYSTLLVHCNQTAGILLLVHSGRTTKLDKFNKFNLGAPSITRGERGKCFVLLKSTIVSLFSFVYTELQIVFAAPIDVYSPDHDTQIHHSW